MSKITILSQEEVTLGKVSDMRENTFSDNILMLETCRKRKRSDEEEEEEEGVEEDNDGFKTPTRLENRISEVRECPPAPRKGEKKYSTMHRGVTMSCRRRLGFSPENASFITDLQWRTTTMTIKK
ncbi:hypothetical protein N665_0081s0054 [Sinapis alba]|nr:hypothetical protein N665_0081s0054 [Sinapis alba]